MFVTDSGQDNSMSVFTSLTTADLFRNCNRVHDLHVWNMYPWWPIWQIIGSSANRSLDRVLLQTFFYTLAKFTIYIFYIFLLILAFFSSFNLVKLRLKFLTHPYLFLMLSHIHILSFNDQIFGINEPDRIHIWFFLFIWSIK